MTKKLSKKIEINLADITNKNNGSSVYIIQVPIIQCYKKNVD
jgi:hypothetical protein